MNDVIGVMKWSEKPGVLRRSVRRLFVVQGLPDWDLIAVVFAWPPKGQVGLGPESCSDNHALHNPSKICICDIYVFLCVSMSVCVCDCPSLWVCISVYTLFKSVDACRFFSIYSIESC